MTRRTPRPFALHPVIAALAIALALAGCGGVEDADIAKKAPAAATDACAGLCGTGTTCGADGKCSAPATTDACGGACTTGTTCNTVSKMCDPSSTTDVCGGRCAAGTVCDVQAKKCFVASTPSMPAAGEILVKCTGVAELRQIGFEIASTPESLGGSEWSWYKGSITAASAIGANNVVELRLPIVSGTTAGALRLSCQKPDGSWCYSNYDAPVANVSCTATPYGAATATLGPTRVQGTSSRRVEGTAKWGTGNIPDPMFTPGT